MVMKANFPNFLEAKKTCMKWNGMDDFAVLVTISTS